MRFCTGVPDTAQRDSVEQSLIEWPDLPQASQGNCDKLLYRFSCVASLAVESVPDLFLDSCLGLSPLELE